MCLRIAVGAYVYNESVIPSMKFAATLKQPFRQLWFYFQFSKTQTIFSLIQFRRKWKGLYGSEINSLLGLPVIGYLRH